MTRSLFRTAAIVSFVFVSITSQAQELKTAFFLEDYAYGYRLNPALQQHSTEIFSGLLVDNFTLFANTNVGIADFLFPYNGELVTGLNSHVSAEDFLNGLPSVMNATFQLNNNFFSAGKRLKDGKSQIMMEINMKGNLTMSMPKSLFEFLKSGDEDNSYSFSDAFMHTRDYIELSAGYSREIGDFTVGAVVKGLLGFAEADARIDEMTIVSRNGEVTIAGEGDFNIAMPTISLVTKNGHYDYTINKHEIRFSGFGAAMDLGLTYRPADWILLSASVTDLGGIQWINSQYGIMHGIRTSSGEDVIKSLKEVAQYNAVPLLDEKSFHMVDGGFHLGVRMDAPFLEGLSAGASASYRSGDTRIADFRLGVSYRRWDVLNFAVSAGVTSFGPVLGAMVNLNLKHFAVFGGTDGFIFEFTPQYLPVRKVNSSFKFGVALRR